MERKQRVAKLEALLARVQSRSHRGETHGNAAVAMPPVAVETAARVAPAAARPVVQAAPAPQVAASPKPSPVAASAPPQAEPARPAARPEMAAHEMQEEVATVVRDVPVEALAAIAAATAQQQAKPTPAAGTPATAAAASPTPAAGQPAQPSASVPPAFRGTSAFGGLSKKMTLIGTAPPANWPPRGAEQSVPPPEPPKAEAAEEPQPTEQEEAPQIQATESEGDLDALLGDESNAPPVEREPEPAPIAAAAAPVLATSSTAITEPKKSDLPIVTPEAPLAKKKSSSGTTVVVMIVLWLIAMAVIWFVYRKSM